MQLLYFVLAGVVFGLANVIPGVSGGTMAVVFGIYERLLSVLSDPLHNIKKEWKFLVTFAIGLAIGILAFGKLMNWALVNYPAQSAMFFIGVILGSIPMLFKSSFLPGGKGIGAGIMLALIMEGSREKILALRENPAVKMMQIFDDAGNIDLDKLYNAARPRFENKLTVSVPLLGDMRFDQNDVDKLYRYIQEA